MPATACFPGVTQRGSVEVGIHGFRARLEFFVEESRFHLGLFIAGAVMRKLRVENPLHEEDGIDVEVQPGARLPHHHVIGVWVQEDSDIPAPNQHLGSWQGCSEESDYEQQQFSEVDLPRDRQWPHQLLNRQCPLIYLSQPPCEAGTIIHPFIAEM